MAITKEMLENYLKEKLAGKKYEIHGGNYIVGETIIDFFKEKGINCRAIRASEEKGWGKQTAVIKLERDSIDDYRCCTLLYVEIKKEKGKWHQGYYDHSRQSYDPTFSGKYDWNFKDFNVVISGGVETVEEAIEKSKRYLNEQKAQKDNIRQKAVEVLKRLNAELGESDARKVIDDLSKNYYDIRNKIEGE